MKQSVAGLFLRGGGLSCVCLAGGEVFDREVCELGPHLESPIPAKSEVLLDEDGEICVCECVWGGVCVLIALV